MRALFAYDHGIFGRWALNSVIYAVGGAALSTIVCGCAGYALGKYRFPGSVWLFRVIVAAVLLPQIMLAIPQFLLLAKFGLTNNYAAVILPQLVSPFAIYLCKIYAEASVSDDIIEAARVDGGSESTDLPVHRRPPDVSGLGDRIPPSVHRHLEQLPAAVRHAQPRPAVSRSPRDCTDC